MLVYHFEKVTFYEVFNVTLLNAFESLHYYHFICMLHVHPSSMDIDHSPKEKEYRAANTFIKLQNVEITTEKGKTRIL